MHAEKSLVHTEKKYIYEHNNGFINEHKDGFRLELRKRIKHFVL